MNITLDFGTLYSIVARSLSIIGKRASDDKGNNIFGTITLGTAEKMIVCDFFTNAFTEICGTIGRFITSEVRPTSTAEDSARIDFWSTEAPATANVERSGQLWYKYDTRTLKVITVGFTFGEYNIGDNDVFYYDGVYYDETLVPFEPLEEITNAITINYFGVDPQEIDVTSAGLFAVYNGQVYTSVRTSASSEITPSATTIYYDPSGVAYRWQYGAMQVIPGGVEDGIELVITTPDNWNASLQLSLRQSLQNYCVSYALWSWFIVTAPHIAEKYLIDTQRQMASILETIHQKKEPVGEVNTQPTSSVTPYTPEEPEPTD